MPDATSKIRIRLGQVEIEYEGSHAFLSQDLPKLLQTTFYLHPILQLRDLHWAAPKCQVKTVPGALSTP